jgi:prepilin-type N-terminal cleavage/methylation domain-containing protein
MSLKLIQQEKGFTLIEIMIALLILAGGLMATAYMQTRSVNDGTTANRLTRRVTGAEDKIEDLYTRTIEYNKSYDSFFKYEGDLPTTGIIHWDNDTSPYYKISSQALEGDPGLEMLTTIQVKIIPKGEKMMRQGKEELLCLIT